MDIFKSFLLGLTTIIVGIWAFIGLGVLLTAGWIAGHPDDGVFVWQWFTWVWIAPDFGVVGLIAFMACIEIGDRIRE